MPVFFTTDPSEALARATTFLSSQPVEHNLILTLLNGRIAVPEPGRYWVVERDGRSLGVVFQSPLSFSATLTPMAADLVEEVVEAVAAQADLPGVNGEVATVARFAGRWTESQKSSARPTAGQRLYEVKHVEAPAAVPGGLRVAEQGDVPLLIEWMGGFAADTGEQRFDVATMVPRRVSDGQFFLWDDDGPRAIASITPPVAEVSRIQTVYTPPDIRRQGYGGACVAAVSRRVLDDGLRCILYTDLGNPISNSVYRAIGFRAVSELLRYRFGT